MQAGKGVMGTALGLLGTAFGMLVHQVAMHCFERAALMASLWNMLTTLMGARHCNDEGVCPAIYQIPHTCATPQQDVPRGLTVAGLTVAGLWIDFVTL